jgi:hypothetical protein
MPQDALAPVASAQEAPHTTPAPSYGAYYYAHYSSESHEPYRRDEQWLNLFRVMARRINEHFHPVTVLDAGCAIGLLVEALREIGIDASGFDVSEYAIAAADEGIADHVRVGSLLDPIEGRYDLVTCIEVIEHLPPERIGDAVRHLCAVTDRVLFSSAPDEFGEPTHTALRPTEAWSVEFARNGFFRRTDRDASYVSPWATVYERGEPSTEDLVRSYDRSLARLQREVVSLRATAIDLENRLEALFTDADAEVLEARARGAEARIDELERLVTERDAELVALGEAVEGRDDAARSTEADLAATEAELAATRREVLRLRDAEMGLSQQLGHTLGRVRALEDEADHLRQFADLYHDVVHSTTWRTTWKLMAPYRRVRERLER